ncbi:MAG: hypothetical protein MJ245_00360 [Clostridia bacterium]|nr:hypothetical protein [Clostridia bacterium]
MVDFKEELAFEEYKDKNLFNAKKFKKDIKKKFGFEPDGSLYRKIINYQIKKYGHALEGSMEVQYIPRIGQKNPKGRRRNVDRASNKQQIESFIERNSKKK